MMTKLERKLYRARYYQLNKDRAKAVNKKWHKDHPGYRANDERRAKNLTYWKTHPWANHYRRAQTRCLYDVNSSYYGRVEFNITIKETKEIWIQNEAWLLDEPSIDRKDDKRGYTVDNIQFIELSENKSKKRGLCAKV